MSLTGSETAFREGQVRERRGSEHELDVPEPLRRKLLELRTRPRSERRYAVRPE